MDGSIKLTPEQRKALLGAYRAGDAGVARRAHVLLLLHDGLWYRQVAVCLYASNDLIADCVRRFSAGGIHEALESDGARARRPTALGCPRSRTGCATRPPKISATAAGAGRVRCWRR